MRWNQINEARSWKNDPSRCTMVTLNALCDHFGKERPDQTRAPMTGVGVLEGIRAAGLKYGMMGSIYDPQRETVRAWVARHPKGAFYISTAGHAMAVIDGKLYDAAGRGLDRRIVQSALEVYDTERVAAPAPIVIRVRTDESDVQRSLKTRWVENILIASVGKEDVAWFRLENNGDGTACVHASVDASMRRKGISTLIYDIIEMQLEQKGVKLVPYHLLSDEAYAFWQKRDPDALKNHRRSGAKWSSLNESFALPQGFKDDFVRHLNDYHGRMPDDEIGLDDFRDWYDPINNLHLNGGMLYRVVFLPDESALRRDDLGTHWSTKPLDDSAIERLRHDAYMCGDHEGELQPFYITAHTPPANVHIERVNVPEEWQEYEVNLIDPNRLTDVKITGPKK